MFHRFYGVQFRILAIEFEIERPEFEIGCNEDTAMV